MCSRCLRPHALEHEVPDRIHCRIEARRDHGRGLCFEDQRRAGDAHARFEIAPPINRGLERLAGLALPWDAVTLLPSDDRIVPITDPLSNAGMLARVFSSTAARVLPLVGDITDYRKVGEQADALLRALEWPLDLVWLGMGADGHFASLFPGAANLEEGLALDSGLVVATAMGNFRFVSRVG